MNQCRRFKSKKIERAEESQAGDSVASFAKRKRDQRSCWVFLRGAFFFIIPGDCVSRREGSTMGRYRLLGY